MRFDDQPLTKVTPPASGGPGQRPSQTPATRWVIVAAGAIVGIVALTVWWLGRAQPTQVIPSPTSATLAEPGSRRPAPEPMQLPPLADSDLMLRELGATLSRHPLLARVTGLRGVVRGAVLAVVQIGDGKTPSIPLAVLRPPARLEIAGQASGRVEAASFARWDAATQALVSVRARDAAQVYVNVKPLFDEAYQELGYPGGDFDAAITRAIRTLDATPPSPADLALLRRDGYFEYADSSLRSLQPVQKQLVLLGRENRARVQRWLHQFAAALDLKIGN